MTVAVAFSRRPFGQDLWVGRALQGQSLAEIAAGVPDLPARFWTSGVICINGAPVAREHWVHMRPRADARVPVGVTLHLPLQDGGGGGGSGKQTLAIVATIALLAATAFVGAGFGAGIAGGWFAAGSVSAKVLSAGLSLAGALAINAVFAPPPQPSVTALSTREQEVGSVALEQNRAERGASLQLVAGTRRIAPNLVALPLTEIVGDDEYVEALMALAGPHAISDLRIGDALSDDLSDVAYQVREGWGDDEALTLVTRQGYEDPVNITLSDFLYDRDTTTSLADPSTPADDLPIWHQVQSRTAPDEVWLSLYWIEGFFDESASSDQRIPFRLRMRRVGETSWINLPELHFIGHRQALVRKMIKLMWQATPAIPTAPTAEGPVTAYRSVPAQTTSGGPASGGWTADSYFGTGDIDEADNVALYSDRVEIYLDEGTFPKGTYEIQIMKGQMVLNSSFTAATYNYSGISIPDLFGYYLSGGVPRTVQEQGDLHGKVALVRIASVWNQAPLSIDDGLAKLAIKVKNRSVTRLSVTASGYVRDWENGEWGRWRTTSNPAPHFRAALASQLNRRPLKATQIDDESLVAWRAFCAAQGYAVNAVLQGGSVAEALQTLAAAGHATPRAMPYGVAWEYDRSAEDPIQIFSPRNSAGYRFEKAYPTLPDGFLVTFPDAALNYQPREITVLRDGVSGDAADLVLDAIQYDQITDEALATQRARLDLRQAELRAVDHSIEADVEAILCRRGDLVGFQHDVIDRHAGHARIRSVTTADGLVTGLALDQEIPVSTDSEYFNDIADVTAEEDVTAAGAKTGVSIRLGDGYGTVLTKEIDTASGSVSEISFATPFAAPPGLETGCLVVAGRLASEYRRMIVKSVTPKKDLTATLVLVDEAPSIHPLAA